MNKVDMNNFKRKEIFEFFSNASNPFYGLSFNIDITKACQFSKQHKISSYMVLTWCVTKAINLIDEFKYCYKDQDIYQIGKRIPSFTDLDKDTKQFKIITMDILDDCKLFAVKAKQVANDQKCFINYQEESDSLIYISCIPWLDLTSVHSEGLNNKYDSIPRITWGKYHNIGDQIIVNLTIEVNHAFIDGVHIGLFKEKLDEIINNIK